VRSILQLKRELRKATNANKIIINKRETKDDTKEAKKAKIKTRKTRVDAKVDAKVITIATTIATTTTNKKRFARQRITSR